MVWIVPEPASRETPMMFPEASTRKLFEAAEKLVPTVALVVVERVELEMSPAPVMFWELAEIAPPRVKAAVLTPKTRRSEVLADTRLRSVELALFLAVIHWLLGIRRIPVVEGVALAVPRAKPVVVKSVLAFPMLEMILLFILISPLLVNAPMLVAETVAAVRVPRLEML